MNITIEAFVEIRKAELDKFAADWRQSMKDDPENYNFDEASEGDWREQEESFLSLEHDN